MVLDKLLGVFDLQMVLDKLLGVFDLHDMEIEIPMLEKVMERKRLPVDP